MAAIGPPVPSLHRLNSRPFTQAEVADLHAFIQSGRTQYPPWCQTVDQQRRYRRHMQPFVIDPVDNLVKVTGRPLVAIEDHRRTLHTLLDQAALIANSRDALSTTWSVNDTSASLRRSVSNF